MTCPACDGFGFYHIDVAVPGDIQSVEVPCEACQFFSVEAEMPEWFVDDLNEFRAWERGIAA